MPIILIYARGNKPSFSAWFEPVDHSYRHIFAAKKQPQYWCKKFTSTQFFSKPPSNLIWLPFPRPWQRLPPAFGCPFHGCGWRFLLALAVISAALTTLPSRLWVPFPRLWLALPPANGCSFHWFGWRFSSLRVAICLTKWVKPELFTVRQTVPYQPQKYLK